MHAKIRIRAVPAAVLALVLAGCSASSTLLESKRVDYKSAGKVPSLEVPPELTTPSGDDRYAVPDGKTNGVATYSDYSRDRAANPVTNATAVVPSQDKARIERSGTQRWLVVRAKPEELWPVLKEFWQENGFLIKTENAETGILETDWAENRAKIPQDFIRNAIGKVFDDVYSTPERDKFRTRVERGAEAGTSEIYISHRGMVEMLTSGDGRRASSTIWQPRPADPELEAEFLKRLMVRVGVDQVRASEQLAARTQVEQATLTKAADGSSTLSLKDAFDRAWRRVGLALDRVGFTVEDRDRSKGLYFVRYASQDPSRKQDDTGILSKLAFWRSNDAKAVKAEQYRIAISDEGDKTAVQVLDKAGASAQPEAAGKILSLLYQELK